jgi:DNA-directed RNA polymerase specialized sigma24 family protein
VRLSTRSCRSGPAPTSTSTGCSDDAAIRPWIAQLTRRCSIDVLRRSNRKATASDDSAVRPAGLDDELERLDDALDLRDALGRLGGDCQDILDRFFTRDESYRTIGDALDLRRLGR